MKSTEEIFKYKNIKITKWITPAGKKIETMINMGDHWEVIANTDNRANEAFIYLHNKKWGYSDNKD